VVGPKLTYPHVRGGHTNFYVDLYLAITPPRPSTSARTELGNVGATSGRLRTNEDFALGNPRHVIEAPGRQQFQANAVNKVAMGLVSRSRAARPNRLPPRPSLAALT